METISCLRRDLLVHPPDLNTICSICQDLFTEPVVCPSGHTFCKACITSWMLGGDFRHCPLGSTSCRLKAGLVDSLPPVLSVKNMINERQAYCEHHDKVKERTSELPSKRRRVSAEAAIDEDGGGCTWTGSLGDLSLHLNTKCPFVPVRCSFCRAKLLRMHLERHEKTECEYRRVTCAWCDEAVVWRHRELHASDECRMAVVACPNGCRGDNGLVSEMPRGSLVGHRELCPLEPVRCPIPGCRETPQRQHAKEHQGASVAAHLLLLVDENRQLNQRLDAVRVEMERDSIFNWTVDETRFRRYTCLRSPVFHCRQYLWRLRLEGCRGYGGGGLTTLSLEMPRARRWYGRTSLAVQAVVMFTIARVGAPPGDTLLQQHRLLNFSDRELEPDGVEFHERLLSREAFGEAGCVVVRVEVFEITPISSRPESMFDGPYGGRDDSPFYGLMDSDDDSVLG